MLSRFNQRIVANFAQFPGWMSRYRWRLHGKRQ